MKKGNTPAPDVEKPKEILDFKDMTKSQLKALSLAIEGKNNLFITGGAGTGKSYVTQKIIKVLQDIHKNVLVCATTGVAAMNIEGGMTVHSAFGLSAGPCLKTSHKTGELDLKTSSTKLLIMADVILIDEVTLSSPDLFDSVVLSIRNAEKKTKQSKKLIVVGDFFQLGPPIDDSHRALLKSFYGMDRPNWYAFMGKYWDECNFQTVILTEVMRQKDPDFVSCLEKARRGDSSCLDFLNATPPAQAREDGVYLYAYRNKAIEKNGEQMALLEGQLYTFHAKVEYEEAFKSAGGWETMVQKELSFKLGANILFTASDYGGSCSHRILTGGRRVYEKTNTPLFVNGMSGVIISVNEGSVIIKVKGGALLEVCPMTRPIYTYMVEDDCLVKKKVASVTTYPFTLGYALTIHKAQGKTLNNVIVDPDTFASGQLYVALSRAKTRDGLSLTRPIRPADLKVDSTIQEFYKRIEKKAGLSTAKGRPVKNIDGSRRSKLIWVPISLEKHVREEVRQNRILDLPKKVAMKEGRVHIRVTEELYEGIVAQIKEWKKGSIS